MKLLIGSLIVLGTLSGCATPQQNAALAGAIGGAIIMNSVNQPRPVHVYHPRPLYCHSQYVGRDYHGRPVYQQVCR